MLPCYATYYDASTWHSDINIMLARSDNNPSRFVLRLYDRDGTQLAEVDDYLHIHETREIELNRLVRGKGGKENEGLVIVRPFWKDDETKYKNDEFVSVLVIRRENQDSDHNRFVPLTRYEFW